MGNKRRNKSRSMGEERRVAALRQQLKQELLRDLRRDPVLREGVFQVLDESRPVWTPFEEVTDNLSSPLARKLGIHDPKLMLKIAWGEDYNDVRVFQNSRYFVYKRPWVVPTASGGQLTCFQLSIKDLHNTARHDWRDLQRIKNELCGPEFEACELYPAESRLVDTSNQYYVWVLPEGERFPIGFEERCVMEGSHVPGQNQRAFEPGSRPHDLRQPDSLQAEIDRLQHARQALGEEISDGDRNEGRQEQGHDGREPEGHVEGRQGPSEHEGEGKHEGQVAITP